MGICSAAAQPVHAGTQPETLRGAAADGRGLQGLSSLSEGLEALVIASGLGLARVG